MGSRITNWRPSAGLQRVAALALVIGVALGLLFAISSGKPELGLLGFGMGTVSTIGLYRYIRSILEEEEPVADKTASDYHWRWIVWLSLPFLGALLGFALYSVREGSAITGLLGVPVGFIWGGLTGTVFLEVDLAHPHAEFLIRCPFLTAVVAPSSDISSAHPEALVG